MGASFKTDTRVGDLGVPFNMGTLGISMKGILYNVHTIMSS